MMSKFGNFSVALWAIVGLFSLNACGNLEKEILVELPDYDSQVVLECYLEPGRPFRLLLTKSASYFAPFPTQNDQFLENLLEQDAEVVIRYNGEEIVLANQLSFDPETGKLYNYSSSSLVPENYDQDFVLDVTTQTGQSIGAITRILPVVPIDSIVVLFDEEIDTLARTDTYLTDDPQSANFYRRSVHLGTLETEPEQDFATDDEFLDSEKFFFGTAFDYAVGDTLIFTIYHIDQAYFRFFSSVQQAVFSNGNPFGQPSPVISNLEGTADAIGIFTGLSYDRVTTIIEK
jgi:hypothetical protein